MRANSDSEGQKSMGYTVDGLALLSSAPPGQTRGGLNEPADIDDFQQSFGQSYKTFFWASLRWWLAELSAILVFFGAMVSIIAIARHYHGKGVLQIKLPSGLILNGLIALLFTLARAALMVPVASVLSQEAWLWLANAKRRKRGHPKLRDLEVSDAASRGAFGSLLFLRDIRRSWLAYTAAIVMIISLLFGTFTQQLLTLESFPVDDTAFQPGNVPWSKRWDEFDGRLTHAGLTVPLSLKAATYNGILTSDVPPIQVTCSTRNCTWPVTPTLAICGGCIESPFKISCNDDTCNYTLPSGMQANLTNLERATMGVGSQLFPSPGAKYRFDQSDKLYIANFELVARWWTSFRDGVLSNRSTVAAECALWMCLQSHEIRTIDGNQHEAITHEFSTVANSNTTQLTEHNQNFDWNVTFLDPPPDLNSEPHTVYSIGASAVIGLQTYLHTLFNGSIQYMAGTMAASNDVTQAVWNVSQNLDPWIKTVAGSMTNVIRSTNPTQLPQYDGTAYQLGYDVRWAWIILPCILVLTTSIMLAVIIIETTRSPVQAWKGSPLALLFMDVDQAMRMRANEKLDELDGIASSVGKNHVVLGAEGRGKWRIKML